MLHIPAEDYEKLRLLASAAANTTGSARQRIQALRDELDKALVLPRESLPSGVVMLGSSVTVLDLDLDEKECYTLALPQHADIDQQRISVLSPLGTALLGYREGDDLTWTMPGGQRRLQILKVVNLAA